MNCPAKRLECVQLAGAVVRHGRPESGSKLHALQTLRAIRLRLRRAAAIAPPSLLRGGYEAGRTGKQTRIKRGDSHRIGGCTRLLFVFSSYSLRVSFVFRWCSPPVSSPGFPSVNGGDFGGIWSHGAPDPCPVVEQLDALQARWVSPGSPGP